MKLLRIESDSEECIDEVLMVVPDEYDREMALDEVCFDDDGDPFIATVLDIPNSFYFDFYRPFYG